MLRTPLNIYSVTSTDLVTAGYTFMAPTDITSLTFKMQTIGGAALTGTSPTLNVYIQTTDDGGATWYDCAAFTQLTTNSLTNAAALWAVVPVDGTAAKTNGYTGVATAASITAANLSGLPILSQLVKISFVYGGTVATNAGVKIDVKATQASFK